ncbi:hypothetical protein L3X38_011321 [Prunus dulcis]|uniref:Uncharacterized protein n=1 Tax=Prunus dulcis TaxID=3755 RepID=A0AAD4WH54_PRUDU|nr:hypothetical protein L3X38_011321 [Prunus dulcis]
MVNQRSNYPNPGQTGPQGPRPPNSDPKVPMGSIRNRSIPTQQSVRACRRDEFPYLDRQKWRPEEGDRSRRSYGRKSPFSGGWSGGRCRGRAGS